MSDEQQLRTENPFEQQIERALLRAGEPFTSDHDGTNPSHLDFCLRNRDIHVEVKTMHSERVAEQMSRVSNVIVAQGANAIAYLAALIAKSADLAPVAQPPIAEYQRRLFEECRTANWDPDLQNSFAEEIAHLHEELSEAFRVWRKYKDCGIREVNGKLEGVAIEFADALIGMFYNAELHGFDLFAAVEQKHQFNLTRNYVKEGRQLHAGDSCG